MTGKRSVLLSLSRLCGRVCIILLIAAGFVEHQLRVVHHGLLFTPNSEAEIGVLSSAPVLFAEAGKANAAPPSGSPACCAPGATGCACARTRRLGGESSTRSRAHHSADDSQGHSDARTADLQAAGGPQTS
jgi:hypothetical protein